MVHRTLPFLVTLLLFAATPGLSAPHTVSLQPHEERLPTPLLKRGGPEQGRAGRLLASCLVRFALGDLKGAEGACSEAIALDPGRADAFKLRAYAYLLEQRYERANADFRAAMRLKPADDQAVAGYAQSLSDMGRYSTAVTQFHKALALAPEKAAYWNGLCWSQAATGKRLGEALTACNKALRIEPEAAAAYNSRGLVHLRMQKFTTAIADYSRALQLSPDQSSARFGLGLARLSRGDRAGASDIRQARRSEPDIDRLFIGMGVLPERCGAAAVELCPPGFPAGAVPNTAGPVIAKVQEPKRQEIMRMAGLFPSLTTRRPQ
jgi:tetratricopeptide (TPR) repeat protein